MACIAKRRSRYVIDFYDTYGKRRWITMPQGTTKKKTTEKLREIEDQLRRGIYLPDKKVLVTLGQIMAYAVRHGYIDYNSVRDAERPRGNGESEESKIRVLTPSEINSFLEAEKDIKYHTLFKTHPCQLINSTGGKH